MFKYAQIDAATGRCVSVSYLSGEIESASMIQLTESDDIKPGDIRNADGTWTRPAPVPPQPSRIDQLGSENAIIALELANTQIQAAANEQATADLLLQLVQKGVI